MEIQQTKESFEDLEAGFEQAKVSLEQNIQIIDKIISEGELI